MALPTLDATFASSADLPRKQMLAKWLVEELGETQAPSSVLVSGLSDTQYNGLYVYDGDINGKSSYSLNENINILWSIGLTWTLSDSNTGLALSSESNVTYPWLATGWFDEGIDPTGLAVTESPAPSPLSNYYDFPERYLWAKIAVATGGPKTEADYISLPTRYVWSDIYNAVSGNIAQSTVVVSYLSDSQYNGSYVYDGLVNGRASYRLNANVRIYWNGSNWEIYDTSNDNYSSGSEDVLYPWLVSSWQNEGIDPIGIVLTPQTPNHTDWSENVALGHIAAAYRGDTGNPANLATYIDWPWRYKVAAIIDHLIGNYNAVIVSGAGTATANGTYTLSGQENGKNKYINGSNYIAWSNVEWLIFDDITFGDWVYATSNNTEFPWDAVFATTNGDEPAPTLTPTNV